MRLRDPADLPQEPDLKFVYFIQGDDDGPVKIGVAIDPESRLRALQTGYPYRLRILHAHRGGHDLERTLHTVLRADRLQGEWFKPSSALKAFIAYPERLDALLKDRPPAMHAQEPSRGDGGPWGEAQACEVCGVVLAESDYPLDRIESGPLLVDGQCHACKEAEPYRTGELA